MKTNIAVFFGGKSVEHEVSIISAVQAMLSINTDKYEVIPIYITKDNRMYTSPFFKEIEEFKNIPELLKKSSPIYFNTDGNRTYLNIITEKKGIFSKTQEPVIIDVAFPVVHGTNVEDGALQGFIKTLNLPFVGCDVLSSAVCMDKYVSKLMLKQAGVPVLDGYKFTSDLKYMDIIAKIEAVLKYPVIIKPVNLGSSVGITKANDKTELEEALETAFTYSKTILAEPAVVNLREINVSVLGDSKEAMASVCEEPFSKDKILSYKDKYQSESNTKGMVSLSRQIPADISQELKENIQKTAVKAFKELDCNGVVRIDFLFDSETNEFWLNEINTIPGSLSFYLWEKTDLPYPALIEKLIELALKRGRLENNLIYSFDTNILSGVGFGTKGSKS
ncbi:MAG: D-alanine--D-alanine ligase [Oscillospiraceae bacterium]|jgi:D-alanine-D-alanine ligase|nr:D-alanine--D-alanine ligase [Oscillospiraceae bacterium]